MSNPRLQQLLQEGHPLESARRILDLEEQVTFLHIRVRALETQNKQLIALNAVMDDILKCFDGCTTLTRRPCA